MRKAIAAGLIWAGFAAGFAATAYYVYFMWTQDWGPMMTRGHNLMLVLMLFGSILVLAFAPWLDTSRIRSAKYRPWFKYAFWTFAFTCVALGYLGSRPAEGVYTMWSQIFTVLYFAYFLVAMPVLGLIETPGKLPRSINEAVLGHGGSVVPMGSAAAPETR